MWFWLLCSSSKLKGGEEHNVVNEGDLEHIYKLVEEKDGGPSWIQMMDRSTPTMNYRAWRRDPEVNFTFWSWNSLLVNDFFNKFDGKWSVTTLLVSNFFSKFDGKWSLGLMANEMLQSWSLCSCFRLLARWLWIADTCDVWSHN